VKEAGTQTLVETVKGVLREKALLLILDNYEHLVAAAPVVAELLTAGSRLKLVVTSRVRLRLRGEHALAVPPLALPAPRHLPGVAALAQSAAVALLVVRALAARPGSRPPPAAAPAPRALGRA